MSVISRGQRVGRYVLMNVLGEGGMGTVWLAHPHDATDQRYAVKTVSAQYATDNRACTMFIKEASLAAAVDHPNVVRLHDVGIHDDVPFFVMEWIDGYSLRDVAHAISDTGERLPTGIALRIANDLCAGLHAAHELAGDDGRHVGLVHRDVSPHNVLVTRDGVAKLIDFGVAKARDLATGADLSVCGGIKGKVRYMAPEQALETNVDRRADIFSVGAVVYQLLTGRAPFEGPNELAVINGLLATTPVFVPDTLPDPVQRILRRALARRPDGRFATAAEMQDAIGLALVELGEPCSHADVARCLASFTGSRDTRSDDNPDAITAQQLPPESSDIGVLLRAPLEHVVSTFHPPPLHVAMPTDSTVPARVSSFPDDDQRRPARRGDRNTKKGPLSFVLLSGGFVGLLGLVTAVALHDSPPRDRVTSSRESTTEIDDALIVPPTDEPSNPSGISTTTPIIDIGDVEDPRSSRTTSPRPKTRRLYPSLRSPPTSNAPIRSGTLIGSIKSSR